MRDVATNPPKLLFLVTEDWYFCSHRLPLARAARDAGYRVMVATRVGSHGQRILRERFELFPLRLRRRNRNPWKEMMGVREIASLYRRHRPDIVHHVAMKPVMLGSLAARMARVPGTVNAIAGLGYVFSSKRPEAVVLRPAFKLALHWLLDNKRSRIIVQNPDDKDALVSSGMVAPERLALIKGSGVDVKRFRPAPEPCDPPTVTLVSRMLWDKGVGELVAAAELLKGKRTNARFVLVGSPDPESPLAIEEAQLRAWQQAGHVEWWGARDDIPDVWAASHIAVLPSYYGEGVPKALIEAAACGRPIVATDMPGCREIVRDGENGLLVPPRDPGSLADAIERLITAPALRLRMGHSGRERVLREFSEQHVIDQTLDLYQGLLDPADHRTNQSDLGSS